MIFLINLIVPLFVTVIFNESYCIFLSSWGKQLDELSLETPEYHAKPIYDSTNTIADHSHLLFDFYDLHRNFFNYYQR